MAAHQAPLSLGFSRQEHWSGLLFPSMHESEKWKWSRLVVSNSLRPHGLQPTRLLRPWNFPGKSTGVGCHCLLHWWTLLLGKSKDTYKCRNETGDITADATEIWRTLKILREQSGMGRWRGDYFSLSFWFSLVIKFLLCEMNKFLEIHSTIQYV